MLGNYEGYQCRFIAVSVVDTSRRKIITKLQSSSAGVDVRVVNLFMYCMKLEFQVI
jgi:hypothetical protein